AGRLQRAGHPAAALSGYAVRTPFVRLTALNRMKIPYIYHAPAVKSRGSFCCHASKNAAPYALYTRPAGGRALRRTPAALLFCTKNTRRPARRGAKRQTLVLCIDFTYLCNYTVPIAG